MFNTPSRRPIVIMIGLSVLVLLILVSGLFPWEGLNCKYLKVDIHSGRQRTTLYLLFIPVSDTIEETWVSKEIVNPASPPDWKTVCRFAPFWDDLSQCYDADQPIGVSGSVRRPFHARSKITSISSARRQLAVG